MTFVRIAPIAAAVLIATACSSSKAKGFEPSSVSELQARAGCASFVQAGAPLELFVQESGDCQVDGKDVALYLFESNEKRDSWLDAAAKVSSGFTEHGPKWAINTDDRDTAAKIAAKLK